jgi:hypothetical protein
MEMTYTNKFSEMPLHFIKPMTLKGFMDFEGVLSKQGILQE